MRLEHVCDMELVYRREALYGARLVMVVPYGTQEAACTARATAAWWASGSRARCGG